MAKVLTPEQLKECIAFLNVKAKKEKAAMEDIKNKKPKHKARGR